MRSRLAIVLFSVAAVSCGGSQKPQTAPPPLPDTKAEAEPAKPTPPAEKPVEAPKPPPGPIEVTIAVPKPTVKLVSPGKGKKQKLAIAPKAGAKQQVELAFDYAQKAAAGDKSENDVIPTLVLAGEAEIKDVDKDGTSSYVLNVSTTDARAVAGSEKVPIDQLKTVLASLHGLTIGGTVGANGASSDLKVRLEKPDDKSAAAIDIVKLVLPAWPVLPSEAVGVGAKWQVTTTRKVENKLDITETTDYELVKRDDKTKTWTIKGTTKVSGADQDFGEAKFSGITGAGSVEVAMVDGAFYPTLKTSVSTELTATPNDPKAEKVKLGLVQGMTVTPK